MIKAVIIEDEVNVREGLKKMLKIVAPQITIVAEIGFVSKALTFLSTQSVDLVFIDIKLEDGTGFDILEQLETIDFNVIFTTAYNQYAIKAFKYSAIDYLLKPIDPIELQEAIQRSIKTIKHQKEHLELLEILKNNINKKDKKIVIKTTEQRYILNVTDIIRLEANGAYTLFVTKSKNIIASKNIKYFQEILDSSFIRCHQSHLINTSHILEINKNGSILLSDNNIVPYSTRKKSELLLIISQL